MSYKAVVVRRTGDEIKHWKYIKRVKKNGKWRYYYDKSELWKYETKNMDIASTTDKQGRVVDNVTSYTTTDSLFDSKSSSTVNWDDKHIMKTTIKEQGKLSRAIAKGEKWLYDNIFNKLNK